MSNYRIFLTDAVENLILDSQHINNGSNWIAQTSAYSVLNTATAPDGSVTADEITDPNFSGTASIKQTITDSEGVYIPSRNTVSIFAKKDNVGRATRFAGLMLQYNGSTLESNEVRFDTKTGEFSIELSESDAVDAGVDDYGDYWRVWLNATSADQANTFINYLLYPARGTSEIWINDSSTIGTITVWGGQYNISPWPSVYVETTDTRIFSPTGWIQFVELQPEWNFKTKGEKVESRHRTRDGGEFVYKWGLVNNFEIPVSYVNSSFRYLANIWWRDNSPLIYSPNFSISSVHLTNKNTPINQFVEPYLDLFKGKLELGTY